MIIAGTVLIALGKVWGWAMVAAAVGLFAGFVLVQLHAKASFIRFTSDGVTVCYLYQERFFSWSDIRNIRIERKKNLDRHTFEAPLIRLVLWLRQVLHPTGLPTVVLSLSDADKAEFVLPYTYQMPPEKLAELLSQWKLQRDAEQATAPQWEGC